MANSFNSYPSSFTSAQQAELFHSENNHLSNNFERPSSIFSAPPEYSDSIAHKLQQIQNAIGGLHTSNIIQGAHDSAKELSVLQQIDSLQGDILNTALSADDAREILKTAVDLLSLTESEPTQKALIDTLGMAIDKNTHGAVNLNFLSQLCTVITAEKNDGTLLHSDHNQLRIINTAQAAFNGIWKANHTEKQKPLSDDECEKYAAVIPRMEKVLYGINNSKDLQLHAAILKFSLAAFKTTTEHVAIPPSKAGQALKSSINEYINTVGGVMAFHQKEWKAAAKEQGQLKKSTAQLTKAVVGASATVPKSLFALGGALSGSVVGILGLLRLPFGLIGGLGLDINPLTNTGGGFPATKALVGHFLSSPFRHTANGAAIGWEIVDHNNLAYKAYDAIYNSGQTPETQGHKASARQLQSLGENMNIYNP